MPRLTVTISDEHEQILEEQADNGEAFRSKSEVVRECIEAYERVEELSNQMACLEAEVDVLREQREQLKRKAARVEELEEKLRQLQVEYHTLISEGKSPTELEPKLDTTLELETETTVTDDGDETIEATAPSAVEAGTSTTESSTAATETGPAASGTTPGANAARARNSTEDTAAREEATDRGARTVEATESGTSKSSAGTGSGGVEIDEELLYQSPGVGSRLKSALFGGPGGSR